MYDDAMALDPNGTRAPVFDPDEYTPILYFDKEETEFPIDFADVVQRRRAPSQARPTITRVVTSSESLYIVSFFILFHRDTGKEILGMTVDAHKWDVERVDVAVNKATLLVDRVVYNPHSEPESFGISHPKDLDAILVQGCRPIVYVSYGKHATMPVTKMVRMLGFGTDVCRRPHKTAEGLVAVECTSAMWMLYNFRRLDNIASIRQRVTTRDPLDAPIVRLGSLKYRQLFSMKSLLRRMRKNV